MVSVGGIVRFAFPLKLPIFFSTRGIIWICHLAPSNMFL